MEPRRRKKPSEGGGRAAVAAQMKMEINELRARVTELERKLESKGMSSAENVIVLRTIGRDQAKREIRELVDSGVTLYYSDISHRLAIELPLMVEICQELEEAGEVEVDADAV